ncbi:hypothetical protein ACLK1X_06235 [Escherichia coli]
MDNWRWHLQGFQQPTQAGFDANGDAGEDFFAIGKPAVCKTRKTKVTLRSVPR